MKLWKARFEIEVVIAADDLEAAYEHARDAVEKDISFHGTEGTGDLSVYPEPLATLGDLPAGWDEHCIPYGDGDGNTRIGKILPAFQKEG